LIDTILAEKLPRHFLPSGGVKSDHMDGEGFWEEQPAGV
jgi:hypothetical protein